MQKSALHRSVLDSVVAHERRGCGALAHAGRRKLAFLIEYRLQGGNVPTRPAEATCWSVSTWMYCRLFVEVDRLEQTAHESNSVSRYDWQPGC